jgi:hypothetical protein
MGKQVISRLAVIKFIGSQPVLDNKCPSCNADLLETPSGFVCPQCPSGLFSKVLINIHKPSRTEKLQPLLDALGDFVDSET